MGCDAKKGTSVAPKVFRSRIVSKRPAPSDGAAADTLAVIVAVVAGEGDPWREGAT